MKNSFVLLFFLFVVFSVIAQIPPKPPVYEALKINATDLSIDGILDEEAWNNVEWTDDFQDIQGPDFPKPYQATRAKILWSDSMIYIGAYLEEAHIWAKITEDEKIMYYDNDFEIFIDPNGDNHNYYEYEFNALNKKWDLFLQQPYRDTIKPDLKWNCKGLKHKVHIYGSINKSSDQDSAWTIEVAIPIQQMASEIKSGDVWRMNFSRVHWETDIVSEEYKKKDLPENNWVWSPTWQINIHRPEYWGYVHFKGKNIDESFVLDQKKWETQIGLMQEYERRRTALVKHRKTLIQNNIVEKDKNDFRFILADTVNGEIWKVNEKGRLWKEENKKTPKFWIWISGHKINSLTQWDSVFQDIYSLGIRGALLSASIDQIKSVIPLAEKYDIQIHVWMWAMNRGDAPAELMSVNDLGKSLAEEQAYVGYYKFMCPALPETKDFINKKVRELERIDGVSGIHLDYIRYVDVFLPKGLLPKYNLIQDDILPEFDYGYHPYMLEKFKQTHGFNIKTKDNYQHDSLFQQFRMDQVTYIVNDLAWKFSTKELKLTAAVFPDPEMSRKMVRQDWGNWHLDYYFPMVYNGFYLEGTDWIEERVKISKKYHPHSAIFCGLYLPDSKTEEELLESMKAAFRGGASGISFFDYWGLKDHHKVAIKKITEKAMEDNP